MHLSIYFARFLFDRCTEAQENCCIIVQKYYCHEKHKLCAELPGDAHVLTSLVVAGRKDEVNSCVIGQKHYANEKNG